MKKNCLCPACQKKLEGNKFVRFKKPSRKKARHITRLIIDLVNRHSAKMLVRGYKFYLEHETIIAENHFGKLVGVISAINWGEGDWEIVSHAVHPAYQGQGLGEQLFLRMKKKLLRRQPSSVFIFTNQMAFYEKLDFVASDSQPFCEKIAQDCSVCPFGPNGPGYPPCPEIAMKLASTYLQKKGELRC